MLCSARKPQNQRVLWVHKEVGVNYVLYRRLPKHLTYRMLSGDNAARASFYTGERGYDTNLLSSLKKEFLEM